MQPARGDELPAASPTSEDDALYKSDSFRMESMKVLPCSKRFVHDWTECPFAHPQEKARRRDPKLHTYTGIACPSMKKEGCCAFGDHCPYAHNVFEYWLHPTRYRTQLCNDGSNCRRKICFFAHSLDELRVPACKPFVSPEALASAAASAASDAEAKRKAATVGSPLSAFTAISPGPSPQRASLEALATAQAAQAQLHAQLGMDRMSNASIAAPLSPSTADEGAMGSSPADAAVQAALAQLTAAGFSSKDQQVIELVTSLLSQDRVTPEQAAGILQQMLAPEALNQLQARLNTPRASLEDQRTYSDPLGYHHPRHSYADPLASPSAHNTAAAMLARQSAPNSPGGLTLDQMAAVQAAHAGAYAGGIAQYQAPPSASLLGMDAHNRASFESARSSFDTANMSFDRGSMDVGTPRASIDTTYPQHLLQSGLSGQSDPAPGEAAPGTPDAAAAAALRRSSSLGSRSRGFSYSGQLSPVPEQFPMINAPPPSATMGWGPPPPGGRFSFDSMSAADRLSQDLSRMSFEAGAAGSRAAPQTANPYASSFFTAGGSGMGQQPPMATMERLSAPPGGDRRPLSLPLLPALRTAPRSPGRDNEDPAGTPHQQLLGGTALHRLQ